MELKKRTDGCVVGYVRNDSNASNDDRYMFCFSGSATTVLGLIGRMGLQIALMEWTQMRESLDNEEDDE